MTEPPSLPYSVHVVDASVVVKWVLQADDEPHNAHAERLLDDFHAGRVYLVAPTQLSSEVGQALLRAVRRGRITSDQGRDAIEAFGRLRIPEIPGETVVIETWLMAVRLGCSFHDARYLSLAGLLGYPFVHADEKLRNTLAGRFGNEVWIEDYRTPSV